MPSSRPGKRLPTPPVCPVCGEDVPRNALACPECGADHRSGWREDANVYDGTDVPDGAFDYDEFVRQEFGAPSPKPHGIRPVWWITAVVLLVMFGLLILRGVIWGGL